VSLSSHPSAPPSPWQRLLPWFTAAEGSESACQLWAQASCCAAGLQLSYRLIWTPAEHSVLVPLRGADDRRSPRRRDGLWQHTCFEAFVGVLGSEAYWEFNLAPSGDWNVYRFAGYRERQVPEQSYGALPLTVMGPRAAPPAADCRLVGPRALLELEVCCQLPPPLQERLQETLQEGSTLELGLSAVLEGRDGELSYWALQHPGSEPDFHDRRGWLLRL
jgi:hypothetical protein